MSTFFKPRARFFRMNHNYFASIGSCLNQYSGPYIPGQEMGGAASPNGMFEVFGQAIKISGVQDGTSNTIAFGEWRTGDFNENQLSVQDVIDVGGLFPPGRAATSSTRPCPTAAPG